MDPDLSQLDDYLAEADLDGYLVDDDSTNSDQYYLAGFDAPDAFVTLYDGDVHLLFPRSLEYGRARREARADTVERYVDFDYAEAVEEHGRESAQWHVLASFLETYDVQRVGVPPRFPLETADALRDRGVEVVPDGDEVLTRIRATKTDQEVEHVRAAQRANQSAMAAAEDLLAAASIDDDVLVLDGEPLTSERVKEEIEVALVRSGCALDTTIVACGEDAADPHERGSGVLAAGEPILIDIFPQDTSTKYHGDMTRTFVVGEPSETVREWYETTMEAFEAGLDAVQAGVTGSEVHDAVCDVYESAGHPTLRADGSTETGFIHSTGHGVGLDVHELPKVGPGGEELRPGHIISVEPGLYDPAVGGVRIEDLVVVTEDGYENLTDYPTRLVVE